MTISKDGDHTTSPGELEAVSFKSMMLHWKGCCQKSPQFRLGREIHNSHHMSVAGIGVQAEPGNLDRMCCGNLCEKVVRMPIYISFGKGNWFGEGLKEEFCVWVGLNWFLQMEFSSSSPEMCLLESIGEYLCFPFLHQASSFLACKYLSLQWQTLRIPIISESQAVTADFGD